MATTRRSTASLPPSASISSSLPSTPLKRWPQAAPPQAGMHGGPGRVPGGRRRHGLAGERRGVVAVDGKGINIVLLFLFVEIYESMLCGLILSLVVSIYI